MLLVVQQRIRLPAISSSKQSTSRHYQLNTECGVVQYRKKTMIMMMIVVCYMVECLVQFFFVDLKLRGWGTIMVAIMAVLNQETKKGFFRRHTLTIHYHAIIVYIHKFVYKYIFTYDQSMEDFKSLVYITISV